MRKRKQRNTKDEKKDGEYLITYTRHLEKRIRKLETEKQLLDAERLRLEQELYYLRNGVERNKNAEALKSPISPLMKLIPPDLRNVFGDILEILMQIVFSTHQLRDQSLQKAKSKISKLLEEIFELNKKIQEPNYKLLKWYELKSIKAEQPPVSNNRIKKEEDIKSDYAFKIIVLGKPEKTAFIRKYITKFFDEDIKMTIGADFSIKNVEVEGKTVTLRIWDFASEERFRRILPSFYKGADGGIIMYDVSDIKTLKIISEFLDVIKLNVGDIPLFLNIPEIPFKAEEIVALSKKYTFTEITSEVGPKGEHVFELLTKKMLEYEQTE